MLAVSVNAKAVKPSERYTVVSATFDANTALGILNTPIFALQDEGELIDRLGGNGQFTVFASVDDAFASLEANMLPLFCYATALELFGDQPGHVSDVLNYHAAKGRRDSGEVLPADRIRMLNGKLIIRTPGSLEFTGAPGFTAELLLPCIEAPADNTMVHVIDRVVLPYAPASN